MIDILTAKSVPIEQVASRLGHDVVRHRIRCISRDHRDANPSLSFDLRLNRFKCFGCDLTGDVLDLISITLGVDMKEAYTWLMGDAILPNVTPIQYLPEAHVPRLGSPALLEAYWRECDSSGDWLAAKGLDAGRFGVRRVTPAAYKLMPTFPVDGLFIPYYQHGRITYARWRNTGTMGPKSLALAGTDVILYNQDSLGELDGTKALYLAEGETDTMSLSALGHVVIGFPGATQFQLLPRLAGWLEALGERVPRIVLAFDDDEAGNRLRDKCLELFKGYDMSSFDLRGHNDVNDWYNHEYLVRGI